MERWNDVMEDVGNPSGIVLSFFFPQTENFDYENITIQPIVCVRVCVLKSFREWRALYSRAPATTKCTPPDSRKVIITTSHSVASLLAFIG